MRHEIADGDRQQPGPDRARAHRACHGQRRGDDETQPREQQDGLRPDGRNAEHVCERHRLRCPVEDDRAHAERKEDDQGRRPGALQQTTRERPADQDAGVDRVGIDVVGTDVAAGRSRCDVGGGHDPVRGEPVQRSEPDRERLAMSAPRVPTELGHQRQREHGVRGEHDGERRAARERHELEPDEEGEPGDGRPDPQERRELTRLPAPDPEPAEHPGRDVVERGERVQPLPDRHEQRGHHRDADPAVHPQEQRRDGAIGRSAGDPLGHDPDPAEKADRPEQDAERGRDADIARVHRGGGAHVPGEDEHEREGDRRGRPDEVHGQRERALVGGRQRVRRDDGRRSGDRDRGRHRAHEPGCRASCPP